MGHRPYVTLFGPVRGRRRFSPRYQGKQLQKRSAVQSLLVFHGLNSRNRSAWFGWRGRSSLQFPVVFDTQIRSKEQQPLVFSVLGGLLIDRVYCINRSGNLPPTPHKNRASQASFHGTQSKLVEHVKQALRVCRTDSEFHGDGTSAGSTAAPRRVAAVGLALTLSLGGDGTP